ncbi:MAG: type II 3-dehydroquinate dehydratase [Oscillospiraceae bacterium]|nr:type II 3-dehydroquinate dehydratase [Oscillospiraceae bacterium]
MKILVVNGPNLNLLGIREPDIYGRQDYSTLEQLIRDTARSEDVQVEIMQSNHEGVIIDAIQEARLTFDGIVINAGAFTHTSLAIHDALKAIGLPVVEVHISDISLREDFRHFSYPGLVAIKDFVGLGLDGYRQAIIYLKSHLEQV